MTVNHFEALPAEIEKYLSSPTKPVEFTQQDGSYELTIDARTVNLERFATIALAQFDGLLASLPPELMDILDVSLTYVLINPTDGRFAFTIRFEQTWGIDPIFEIENPEVTIYYYQQHFAGLVNTTVHFGIDFEAEIEFPGTAIRAQTLPGSYALADLLAYFSIDASGVGPFQKIKLSEAAVSVETMLHTAAIYVAFEDVFELGIFQLNELIFDIRYRWGTHSAFSGSGQAMITLDIPDHKVVIGLSGEHEAGGGWLFEAYATLENLNLDDLLHWIGDKVGVSRDALPIPESLLDISLSSINISYSTLDKSLDFVVLLELGDSSELELSISVHDQADGDGDDHEATSLPSGENEAQGNSGENNTSPSKGSKEIVIQGTLYLNRGKESEIDLTAIFDKSGSASNFVAVFHPNTSRKVSILDLVSPVIEISHDEVPELEIELSSIIFAHVGNGAAATTQPASDTGQAGKKKNRLNASGMNILAIDLGGGLDLSGLGDLPIVGGTIGSVANLHLNFQLVYATGVLEGDKVEHLNELLSSSSVSLPPQTPSGFSIKTELRLGDDGEPIDLQFGGSSNVLKEKGGKAMSAVKALPGQAIGAVKELPGQATAAVKAKGDQIMQESQETPPLPTEEEIQPAETDAGDEAITWYSIQKVYGPIHIGRIGFKYVDKRVSAYLDASLSLSVLTVTMMGLSASFNFPVSDLSEIDPSFSLDGLGLEFKRGNLELSGTFLRSHFLDPDTNVTLTSYDGMVTIRTETITLSAIGSFAQLADGSPSAFIYGVLNGPIGGPPAFFVMGLAAGFGYNRDLIVPEDLAQIPDHWLVQDAIAPPGNSALSSGQEGDQESNPVIDKLRQVHTSVPPQKGQNFLAAGIRFSTFKILDSFVLVTVAFGNRFEINVFGISTLTIPPKAPETPLAVVQLLIRARYAPDEGELSVRGQLTDNSFLISRNCHLTGGFAVVSWFKGPHEGDFVISFGGYHPSFQIPSHYPIVPRIGFNWIVNRHLTIKGGMYFALTPGLIMAGGALSAVWKSDDAEASFLIGADFLVQWKPFHYDIQAYVSIHAEATIDFGIGSSRESFDASANLHLWGPDFGGHADVSVTVIGIDFEFEIDFGAEPDPQTTISWPTFRESFLDGKPLTTIAVTKGLNREIVVDGETILSLQPKEIEIQLDTVIPFKSVNDESIAFTEKAEASTSALKALIGADDRIAGNMDRMMVVPVGQSLSCSDLTFRLTKIGTGEDLSTHFELFPVVKKVPSALWGGKRPEMNDSERVVAVVSGLQVKARHYPEEARDSKAVLRAELEFLELGFFQVEMDWAQSEPVWQTVSDADDTYQRMLDTSVRSARQDLLQALGLNQYHENIQHADELVLHNVANE